ncbi:MAG: hypothetical protein BWY84_00474 [Candidatus Aerophobetes bacterium ADurb.Bin490]|nr:MAG: hypothetical protein BWY84_00474 [Candidatus Aerophobetes bacterium ADurb.Bin490]HPI03592.1 DUF1385 domain-containing protein [Candidatus Goldiibacteriota bacterium]HPN64312.1 DUF1385 domain-containing protein [Candidatus Goldiibacteriota bacterium]HRQ44522.1 DUF1385 domain-containing protein [Candidatus Goldiibacteriota bacterium]
MTVKKTKTPASCGTKKMSVGGQAVIEGVLMRSPNYYAVSVRHKNGKIKSMSAPVNSITKKYPFLKWPVLRGFVSLIESMTLGFKALDYSAQIYEEGYENKKKIKLTKEETAKKEKKEKLEMTITYILSFGFALLLFIYLPVQGTKLLEKALPGLAENRVWFNLIVVTFKLAIFFLYIWAISFMEDVKRLFMYHGAEHKAIYTFEDGKKLTQKNMLPYTTLHPRCGTAFIFLTMLVSIIIFVLFLPPEFKIWQRILLEIPLLIPIAGLSYELLKFSDKFQNNFFIKILIAPGLAFQKITTKEPDAKMLEVAANSINEVLKLEKKHKTAKAAL